LFKWLGWKIKGAPPELSKYVIIVAPHTSNWDFAVGYSVRQIVGFKPDFLAKRSLFKIPIVGWFLKIIGGHPVDRSRKTHLVGQIVEKYQTLDKFIMTITPEGTRDYSPEWKTGFYRVAQKANVPIVMAGMDYGRKMVTFSAPYHVSGDMEKDLEEMKDFFRPMKGRHPEKGVK